MRNHKRFQALLTAAVFVPLLGGIAACGGGGQNASAQDAKKFVAEGERLLKENILKGAETQFRLASKAAPEDENIHLQLARIYLKENQINAAEAELIPLKRSSMQSEQYHVLLAEVLGRQGNATDLLRDIPAGSRSPEIESDVRAYRGLAELALGHMANAKQMIDDAEQLNPNSVMVKLAKARIVTKSDPATAARELDAALALAPKDSRVLDAKGQFALSQNDETEAMKYFDMAIMEDPANIRALLNRGLLHLKKGDLEAAEKDAAATLAADRGNRTAVYLQASVSTRKGDYARADAIFNALRRIMDRLPSDAYLQAGMVKYHLDQAEQADTFLTRYISQRRDNPQAYETLGTIALKRGDARRAADMLAQAVKLDPKNANASDLLQKARAALNSGGGR